MFFRQVYDPRLAQAAYLIGCQRTGEAIVIDPERDIDRYLDLAKANGLRVVAVAETHIHADFLSGGRELAERVGAKLYVSGMGGKDWSYGWLDRKQGGGSYDHHLLKDGDRFTVGNIDFTAVHTPGHTPEHFSFLVTDRGGGATEPMGIITGDFVFVGDLGRPDLLESAAGVAGAADPSAHALYASARKFLGLPEWLQVWPAHGAGSACGKALGAVPQTTVGYEKRFSPALQAARDEKGFVDFILDGQPEPPLYFARMKRDNRDGAAILGQLPKPRRIAERRDLDAYLGRVADGSVTVVDARPWPAFRDGHVRGSLFAPMGNSFPEVTGSYVDESSEIVLVIDASRIEEAVRDLVRIGLDRAVAFVEPSTLAEFANDGLPLVKSKEIDVATARPAVERGAFAVLDVRRAAEQVEGSVPGRLNIAHTRLKARLADVPKDRPILCHCKLGGRSAFATALLERHGYDVTNLAGGFEAWKKSAPAATRA
jgi:hydroxyacylglutathione hydrolase